MAEFLTMSEAEDKFGSKGKTNAAPVASGATAINTEYEIKTVLSLNKGDVITITNTGASALNINSVDAPAYNVNILIERFN